jgi:hypothetical protein
MGMFSRSRKKYMISFVHKILRGCQVLINQTSRQMSIYPHEFSTEVLQSIYERRPYPSIINISISCVAIHSFSSGSFEGYSSPSCRRFLDPTLAFRKITDEAAAMIDLGKKNPSLTKHRGLRNRRPGSCADSEPAYALRVYLNLTRQAGRENGTARAAVPGDSKAL